MNTDKMSYKDRWLRVFLEELKRRGRLGALGLAVGIIARRTGVDYDLQHELAARERELGLTGHRD